MNYTILAVIPKTITATKGAKIHVFLAQSEQTRSSVVEATIKTWRGPEMDLVWSQQDKKNMSAC